MSGWGEATSRSLLLRSASYDMSDCLLHIGGMQRESQLFTSCPLRNRVPCFGLVLQSDHIWSVGQYSIATSPSSTLSFTKKYLLVGLNRLSKSSP